MCIRGWWSILRGYRFRNEKKKAGDRTQSRRTKLSKLIENHLGGRGWSTHSRIPSSKREPWKVGGQQSGRKIQVCLFLEYLKIIGGQTNDVIFQHYTHYTQCISISTKIHQIHHITSHHMRSVFNLVQEDVVMGVIPKVAQQSIPIIHYHSHPFYLTDLVIIDEI